MAKTPVVNLVRVADAFVGARPGRTMSTASCRSSTCARRPKRVPACYAAAMAAIVRSWFVPRSYSVIAEKTWKIRVPLAEVVSIIAFLSERNPMPRFCLSATTSIKSRIARPKQSIFQTMNTS